MDNRITLAEATERLSNNFGCAFQVIVAMHTTDAFMKLDCPDVIRMALGQALDALGLQEEIDFTLDVKRKY